MSLALRAINRLRKQYRFILNHMRELNTRLFNPPCKILLTHPPSCSVEPLEGRLLLSGSHYLVDSLADNITDDGVLTLREAIMAANTNEILFDDIPVGSATETDIITFDQVALSAEAGASSGEALTITLSGTQLEIYDDLEITGLGSDILTIDANNQSRVMLINDCEVSVSGLTLTRGAASLDGGGIYNDHAIVTLTDSVISGNSVSRSDGGGIYNNHSTLVLADSIVSDNLSQNGCGGGIFNSAGILTLIDSEVSDNIVTGRDGGGGIYSYAGTVTLTDSVVSGNSASDGGGGGIFNSSGPLTLTSSVVSYNSLSEDYGGGIHNTNGLLLLTDSIVSGNSVSIGGAGGIYNTNSVARLTNSTVSGNSFYQTATSYVGGGGIYNGPGSDLTLIASTVSDNTASHQGGGIHNIGTLTLIVSTVSDNTASTTGGGIDSSSPLTLTASVVSGNSASSGGGICSHNDTSVLADSAVSGNTASSGIGGGIYHIYGTLTVADSTVSGNAVHSSPSLDGNGGGIYIYSGTVVLTNSIVFGNLAASGSGGGISNRMGTFTLINSAVYANSALSGGGIHNDFNGIMTLTNSTVAGNLSSDPSSDGGSGIYNESYSDAILNNSIVALNYASNAELQYDDGIHGDVIFNNSLVGVDPGFVSNPSAGLDGVWGTGDDDYGDLRLRDTSIAIDCGDNSLAVDGDSMALGIDLGGNPRIAHSRVDIGAYEYQGAPSASRELSPIVTTLADVVDSTDGLVSLREALVYGSLLGEDVTFDSNLTGGTITLAGQELFIYKSVTVDATSVGGVTIDAAGQSRVMYIAGGETHMAGLAITGGITTFLGGGIYNFSGDLTLTNSTISGNTSYYNGGGIYNASGTLTLTNSTVSGNSAPRGGGISNSVSGVLVLNNSIVALNDALDLVDVAGSVLSNSSLVGIDPGFVRSPSAGVDDVWGTDDDDAGDLRLGDASLAIDFGDDLLAVKDNGLALAVDFDGNPRIAGNSVDIGAYEYQGTPSVLRETLSSIVTTLDDVVNATDGLISLREALVYGGLLVTDVTFDTTLAGGTITLAGQELYLYQSVNVDATSIGGITIDANGQSRVMNITGDEIFLTSLRLIGGSTMYAGGGILNDSGTLTLTNSIVSGNMADNGGGIRNLLGDLILTNSTVSGNLATGYAGGIYSNSSMLVLNNSIVSLNEAKRDVDILLPSNSRVDGFIFNNSLVGVDPGFVRNPSAGTDGVWGTDDDDYGDLRLADTSLAINFGDDALAVNADGSALAVDFEGNARIADGRVDIGAYEYQAAPSSARELSPIVTTLDDVVDFTDGLISLREALVYGGLLGEDVTFDASLAGGTITLDGQELQIYQSVAVDATSIGSVTIDADGDSRVMHIMGCEVSLLSLTLTGGSISDYYGGGGIYNDGGIVTLSNSIVSGNRTSRNGGGGIYNDGGIVTLNNSIVSGNTAYRNGGGGIYNDDGIVTLSNSIVSGNTLDYDAGGGIHNDGGTLTLKDSIVSDNTSTYGDGGGLCGFGGTLILTNSTVTGNTAGIYGGGVYSFDCTVTLTNSTVSGNTAVYSGGGLHNGAGTLSLNNSTVSGNMANSSGGGIYSSIYSSIGAVTTLNNSIVALNEAVEDSDINGNFILNSSLVGIDPGFVRNPSAGDDGEWGTEDDDYGDLRLRPDSVAIDAGDNALAVDADGEILLTDIRGADRITGASVDIGAYEYQDMAGDANGDEVVNLDDFIILKQNYGLTSGATKSQGDFNTDTGVNLDDFIILKQNYGTELAATPPSAASAAVEQSAPAAHATHTPAPPAPSDAADVLAVTAVKPILDPIGQLGWVSPLEVLLTDNFEILDIIAEQ